MEPKQKNALVLITGGVRSGKSTFAEKLALESGRRFIYLATARAEDEEMARRVDRHQSRRPPGVLTVEEALDPHLVLEREGGPGDIILLDCLTLLLSNRILADLDRHGAERRGEEIHAGEDLMEAAAERTLSYIERFCAAARSCPAEILVVANEVGMGLAPPYPLGRVFRDLAGRANQLVAAAADRVWFVVCGIPQRIK